MKQLRFILLAIVLISVPGLQKMSGEVPDNVMISSMDVTFRIVPDKDGTAPSKIEQTVSSTYQATRVPDKALCYHLYYGDEDVNKVSTSVKNVKPFYMSCIRAGIFYDDSRVCVMNIPLEKVGKDVETYFKKTIKEPKTGCNYIVAENYPVRNFTLRAIIPATMKDRYDLTLKNFPENARVTRQMSKDGKNMVVEVALDSISNDYGNDAGSPSGVYYLPVAGISGIFADVNDHYRYNRSFTLEADPDSAEVAAFAARLAQDSVNDAGKIAAVAAWVRDNIRYVAIEHGDLGKKPAAASEVLRNRFGDCKGSASLLKSMLKSLGFDSRLVWIGTKDLPADFTDLEKSEWFDHMIAAVVTCDSILYLDGTVGVQDIGCYSPSIQGKLAMIENGDTPLMAKVPVLLPETSTDKIEALFIIDGKSLQGRSVECCTGKYKSNFVNRYRDVSPDKRESVARDYILDNRTKCGADSVVVKNAAAGGGPVLISGILSDNGAVAVSGKKLYVNPNLFPAVANRISRCEDRKTALKNTNRGTVIRKTVINLPEGKRVEKLPENFSIDNDLMAASLTYTVKDNSIQCDFELTDKAFIIEKERLQEYHDALKKVSRALASRIVLNE